MLQQYYVLKNMSIDKSPISEENGMLNSSLPSFWYCWPSIYEGGVISIIILLFANTVAALPAIILPNSEMALWPNSSIESTGIITIFETIPSAVSWFIFNTTSPVRFPSSPNLISELSAK